MITFHVEKLADNFSEIKKIIPLHWEELALNKDKVPLDPQWDIYAAREGVGEVLFVAMREAGNLVGYFIGFIAPGLHYKTCLTCTMDIFYLHPEKRGSGEGFKLFSFVENELKRRKIQRFFVGSKCHKDVSGMFERMNYERVEIYYSKWLGG